MMHFKVGQAAELGEEGPAVSRMTLVAALLNLSH